MQHWLLQDMQFFAFAWITLGLLTTFIADGSATPIASPDTTPTVSLDINNPSAADPKTPPTSFTTPTGISPDPLPAEIPTLPNICNGENPSPDCFDAMSKGGHINFADDSDCSDPEKAKIRAAFAHAHSLADYARDFPRDNDGLRGRAAGIYYMGADWADQKTRISENFGRVADFKSDKTSNGEYITLSCKDEKGICGKRIEEKGVGGYAWTYSGWRYYYYYITLCPVFFTMKSWNEKFDEIRKDLARGDTSHASQMKWLKTRGQLFLHEMMHLRIATGGREPDIIDETLKKKASGEERDANRLAYGAKLVHRLATRDPADGGGVTRASTNADSYAMLANAMWWWELTGYFPGVPFEGEATDANNTTQDDGSDEDSSIFLHLDIDNATNPATVDFAQLFDHQLALFSDDTPDSDDGNSTNNTATASNDGTSTSSTGVQAAPAPSTAAPPAADICGDWYKFIYDTFTIFGKDFDATKFGQDGSGLKSQIAGCGDLTSWTFNKLDKDPQGYQWRATGKLPIGTKACVGRAVVSAGGASADGCTGSG